MSIKRCLAAAGILSVLGVVACSGAGGTEWNDDSPGWSADSAQAADEPRALEETAESEDIVTEPFASFETPEYGMVQFSEPEPGSLLVIARRQGGTEQDLTFNSETLAKLYEQGVGEPLPERFSFISEVAPPNEEQALDADPEAELQEPVAAPERLDGPTDRGLLNVYPENITDTQFVQQYCQSGLYAYCWIWGTGSSWSRHKAKAIYGIAHAVGGRMTHRVQYRNIWGNWKTPYSVTLEANETSYYGFITSEKRYKESRVYNAGTAGDIYHHAGWFEN